MAIAVTPALGVEPVLNAPPQAADKPASSPEAGPSLEDLLRVEVRGADVAVSTSSRQAQSADLAPGLTHVITRQEIQRLGLRRLGDVLRRLPGVHAADDQLFTRVAVRGIGPGDFNGRVLFLLDGMRLNENIYDGAQIDLDFPVDMSLVERVEFTPGPGSAVYGANALLGVVNVITQRADRLQGAQVRVSGSTGGEWDWRASHAQRSADGAEWALLASGTRIPHLRPNDDFSRGVLTRIQPFENDRAERLMLSWRDGGWSLRGGAVDRRRGLGALVDEVGPAYPSQDQNYYRFVHGAWAGRWGADWDVQAALSLHHMLYRSLVPLVLVAGDPDVPPTERFRFDAMGRWGIAELRGSRPWGDAHELMVGMELQRDWRQRFSYAENDGAAFHENDGAQRLGLFLQDEWRLGDRQRLVLGVRRDEASGRPGRWSPRLAYTWSPAPGDSLKLLTGNAFRRANRFEVASNTDVNEAVPAPETLRSHELAWQSRLGAHWQYSVSVYAARVHNWISRDPQTSLFFNDRRLRSRGLTFETQGSWGAWQLQGSVSRQSSRWADGEHLAYTPDWLGKWAVVAPLPWAGARLSLHGWAQSRRMALGGEAVPGYGVFNAHMGWSPHPQWEAFVGVQNLGGRRYSEPSGGAGSFVTSPDRALWQLGLQWRAAP